MLKEALQYILDGMRPETQDLCGRAYVITPSGAQEVTRRQSCRPLFSSTAWIPS